MYDKDWEVHLALQNPLDPIHEIIDKHLEADDKEEETDGEPSRLCRRASQGDV